MDSKRIPKATKNMKKTMSKKHVFFEALRPDPVSGPGIANGLSTVVKLKINNIKSKLTCR